MKTDATKECLATSRSRRQLQDRHGRRAAFERLKDLKGSKHKYEVKDIDNVYEEVEEQIYAKKRQNRIEEDWIVDDDGSGYVEDGREMFDEELEDDAIFTKKKNEKSGSKRSNVARRSEKVAGNNIKTMFANMPTKKRKVESNMKLDQDELLGDILQDLDKDTSTPQATLLKRKAPQRTYLPARHSINRSLKPLMSSHSSSSTAPSSVDSFKEVCSMSKKSTTFETPSQIIEDIVSQDPNDADLIQDDWLDDVDIEAKISDDKNETKNKILSEASSNGANKENKNENVQPQILNKRIDAQVEGNRGFSSECKKETTSAAKWDDLNMATKNATPEPEIILDSSKLPLITNGEGKQVLRIFWLDAYEDYFNHPGVVYLFGKIWVESAQTHVSCCVCVKNIQREIFLLPRAKKINLKTKEDGDEVQMKDVYEEFNSQVAKKYKILQFKCKTVTKYYAFDKVDVANESEYLEVHYLADYPALPSSLVGETFSHVFGTNANGLELFLLNQKLKGPCWLDIAAPNTSHAPFSWCRFEAVCTQPETITPVANIAPPPLVVMSMAMQTTVNAKSSQNEVALIGLLVHTRFPLDKAPPQPLFQSHFCVMTRPSDINWPWDLKKHLASNSATKIEKMDSERSLLGFLLAKIQKIDPDIIIGHDIIGFDLTILLHRIQSNKIPHWSRLGRLRRTQMPKPSNKSFAEKMAVSGRLICDAKISAKELIRAKSYDLGALVAQVLHVPESSRINPSVEDVKKMFEDSLSIMELVNATMLDASYVLRLVAELNVLPLAMQITNIAGNVLSRTLLGGRSERNEYLLLHAFTGKNFICPDKQYGRANPKRSTPEGEELDEGSKKSKGGRKKPSYAGGLVLDPKKGFYDSFILLMDFNSLYPSIIQEYNICFTTIARGQKSETNEDTEEDLPDLPEPSAKPGILPTEIRKLVESRREVKKLMNQQGISPELKQQYDIRQKALKLTANSMYGCLGFSFSRFYARHLAALVTGKGREILLQTKDLVHKLNFEVIYGDTDSIMINTNCTDYDEVFKLGNKIKSEVNKLYRLLELEIDGVFKYMLLLKKKKYAAITMTRLPNGEIHAERELKGLDIVRRDWSQLSADAGKHILDNILSDQGADERLEHIHSHLEIIKKNIEDGKVSLEELVITKQLTKNPEDYPDKNILSHVQVALRINSRGGKKLRQGDTVPYVICLDGSDSSANQRAYHIEEVKTDSNLRIDTHYYLAHQVHPVVSRLCDPIEGTDSARIAECLGLDPSSYRSSGHSQDDDDDFSNCDVSDEEKYRLCERFTFKCPAEECQIQITVDAPTRGQGANEEFVLQSCPNPKCKSLPYDQMAHIVNKLRRDIRRHIADYYNGWLMCEDPGCNYRTRRIPLQFQRGFPLCSACNKGFLLREYSESQLYKQLCYYEYVFDYQKGCQKNKELRIKSENVKKFYFFLQSEVEAHLKMNAYSSINLGRLFSCLYVRPANS